MMPDFYADSSNPSMSQARTWVLDDGRAGHLNQSLGVADALGIKNPTILALEKSKWFKLLKIFWPARAFHLPKQAEDAQKHGAQPEVVISTGWQNSIQSRRLKRLFPDIFNIQMMNPSGNVGQYDVVAMPLHNSIQSDFSSQDNVITTIGAPNRINEISLKQEAARWKSRLQDCPKPRLVVLLGGPITAFKFGKAEVSEMLKPAIALAQAKNYALLVTTSRRTPKEVTQTARRLIQTSKVKHYFWTGDDPLERDNPFLAFLANCEAIVVSADSISMISESCSANKPVYVWGMDAMPRKKFRTFYDILKKQSRILDWTEKTAEKLALRPPPYPLADTASVASFAQGRWSKRQSNKLLNK